MISFCTALALTGRDDVTDRCEHCGNYSLLWDKDGRYCPACDWGDEMPATHAPPTRYSLGETVALLVLAFSLAVGVGLAISWLAS